MKAGRICETLSTVVPGRIPFDFRVLLPGLSDQLAYELRRPVDPLQPAYRDPVTLTATSQATGEMEG